MRVIREFEMVMIQLVHSFAPGKQRFEPRSELVDTPPSCGIPSVMFWNSNGYGSSETHATATLLFVKLSSTVEHLGWSTLAFGLALVCHGRHTSPQLG